MSTAPERYSGSNSRSQCAWEFSTMGKDVIHRRMSLVVRRSLMPGTISQVSPGPYEKNEIVTRWPKAKAMFDLQEAPSTPPEDGASSS